MSRPDGGPAFPIWTQDMPIHGSPGMTLHDWFAGMALQGILATLPDHSIASDEGGWKALRMRTTNLSVLAYEYADAMLTQREQE